MRFFGGRNVLNQSEKEKDTLKNNLSKLVMVLALGAIIAMPGIVSCKKSNSNGTTTRQIYPGPNYSGQNYADPNYAGQNNHVGHAPLPGTLTLLGSGLAGLGLMGWRKRKKP
jgi:hypothetical protein